ncbi:MULTISPECIES: MATE family efflux transporter [unclassified Roseitalea]|uniref:MATE family efflux transporter n=1 Tax=unclassified Roseitalea TaxID=2639107 RepID=UPI00273D92BE|nr:MULTISPECIES: MATE family efflux transporter [unclassified Roseitalea]
MSTAAGTFGSAPAPMSWGAHARATLALGVPLVGSQLGTMLMNTTDTVMLGWYGVTDLAAGVIATQVIHTVILFGAGIAYAVVPMAASAEGQGDVSQVRRSVRMGLWASVLFCLIMMPILWFIEPILLALGQNADVAALAREYMRIAQFSLFAVLAWWTLRSFLTAIERTRIVFVATIAGIFLNAAVNWAFIFGNWGAPELGVRGAALATLATQSLVLAVVAAYAARADRARPYAIFVRLWRPDWQALGEVVRIGLPIGTMIVAEAGLFVAASILMGWIGVTALAAHGIAMQLASLAFMVPLGMAQAATARVGQFHGRGDRFGLDRAAKTVMALCLGFAAMSAALFFAVPDFLIGLFLDEADPGAPAVLAYAVPLLFVAACFQLADSAQAIGAALLRGLKDTRVPMIIALIAYWPVGMVLAWLLGFVAGLGGIGVWIGLASGLTAAAILLNWRFFILRPL